MMRIPLPVVAQWWRSRTRAREEILASAEVVGSLTAVQAAGVALAAVRDVDASRTVDAIVMATAALLDAIVLTVDRADFEVLSVRFPRVAVLTL